MKQCVWVWELGGQIYIRSYSTQVYNSSRILWRVYLERRTVLGMMVRYCSAVLVEGLDRYLSKAVYWVEYKSSGMIG